MNSLQRCRAVLNGELPDRIPVIPQSFMYAVEQAGYPIRRVQHDGRLMAECHLSCWEKFGYDGIIIDFDDATLAEACGAAVIYRNDEPAIVDESKPLLSHLDQVDDLVLPDPAYSGRLSVWLEATKELVQRVGNEVFIMGRADQGPFTLACMLRGTTHFMMDLLTEDPEKIKRLIDWCEKACVIFAEAQYRAGAHSTSIGDALAGPSLVAPETYRDFAWLPEKVLTEKVQALGIPFSIHICGDTTGIFTDMADTGARILEVDWKLDMGQARRQAPSTTVLMGNVNPSDPMVTGTPAQVEKAAAEVIRKTGGKGLFLSSGCALGRNTPPENLKALVEAARVYGSRDRLMEIQSES